MKSYPRCDFPLAPAEDVAHRLAGSIRSGAAASLIRLGDGEGMVLTRPTPADPHLWASACQHFGPDVEPSYLRRLADRLARAVQSADILGIRDDIVGVDFPARYFAAPEDEALAAFRARFRLRPFDARLRYDGAMRIARLHRYLGRAHLPDGQAYCSAWIHYDLSADGTLLRLMAEAGDIALISAHAELAPSLARLLGREVGSYGVPNRYLEFARAGGESPYPLEELERTCDRIEVRSPGQLFLVGAGIWGKIYCERVRTLGGVAIDVGSVCDAWAGIPSRLAVLVSKYGAEPGQVPDCLRLPQAAEISR
ncbi:MAG TPA: hypothetical protein VMM55_02415 [Thermohalobaculum sp.]|nr:hypothetical protein [Thermohalobaculum sp.]